MGLNNKELNGEVKPQQQQPSPCIQIHSSVSTSILHHDELLTIEIPGSKSITNRILLIAALGKGKVRLRNFLKSADTIAMLSAMKSLQLATFDWENESENVLIVNGNGGKRLTTGTTSEEYTLHVNNSGTAARFLTSLAVVIAGEYKKPVIVTGNEQIKKRPIDSLVDALNLVGCKISYVENEGKLPLLVKDFNGFPGGHIKIDAEISSQYISSILMVAPYAKKPVTLELEGHIVSKLYIDMTIALMKSFGITVTQSTPNIFQIPTGTYTNPPEFIIEPDASTSTYPMAIAAILGRSVRIPHIGTNSIQGDANFAPVILQKMGCKVIQTANETTIQGPPIGGLKPFGTIDMEPLTDTFLTAAVLAAVATDNDSNRSTITGIANQRIKECNRISAMISQLAKFGIRTEELNDGLIIYGQDYTKLKCNGTIHCFDDHRVAMSFSVLGALVPCIVRDRFCTKKTWPEWWEVLNKQLQVQLTPINLMETKTIPKIYHEHEHTEQCIESSTMETNTPTVILIGMRGVGKTTLGKHVSNLLSKQFIDLDDYFYEIHKITANEYIKTNGFDAYRIVEIELLNNATTKYPNNAIISCGGGIIETKEARELFNTLKAKFIIIHLRRKLEDILKEPSFGKKVPYVGEEVQQVYERRLPYYQQVSTHEIYINNSPKCKDCSWREIEHQLSKFIQNCYFPNYSLLHLTTIKARTTSPTLLFHSFVNESTLHTKIHTWIQSEANELPNMIELRILADELNFTDDLGKISEILTEIGQNYFLLKCMIPKLPVILTFTKSEENKEINEEWLNKFTNELVKFALKWNVDILCMDEILKIQILTDQTKQELKSSKIITATLYKGPTLDITLQMTRSTDVFVRRRLNNNNNIELIQIDDKIESTVTLLKGRFLVSSQNQLKEINLKLTLKNDLIPKQYYLFGSPISTSKSPLLHNTGFTAVNLPYTYHLHDTKKVDLDFITLVTNSTSFGGGSITIPMKEELFKEVDRISDVGKLVGAINTLYVNEYGKLVGDNTDYIGIMKVMEPTLKKLQQQQQQRGQQEPILPLRGLVIGGGGTARAAIFALLSIPTVKYITVVNRNVLKAVRMVEEFKCNRKWGQEERYNEDVVLEADSLESLNCSCFDQIHKPNIIISTIPIEAQQASCKFSKDLFKNVKIVVEMVYGKKTPLLEAIEQSENKDNIVIYDGGQVLIEQGLKQFELWTGLSTPFELMRSTVAQVFQDERQKAIAAEK